MEPGKSKSEQGFVWWNMDNVDGIIKPKFPQNTEILWEYYRLGATR